MLLKKVVEELEKRLEKKESQVDILEKKVKELEDKVSAVARKLIKKPATDCKLTKGKIQQGFCNK